MVDQTSPSRRRSIELFFFAYRAFTAYPDRILEQRGLSRVHHRILYFVARDPGLPVSGLLRTLGVSKQALNAPLRQLTERGLIAVDGAEHDRRVRRLTLTAAGRELEAQLSGTQEAFLAEAFDALGPEAEAAWLAAMERMAREAG